MYVAGGIGTSRKERKQRQQQRLPRKMELPCEGIEQIMPLPPLLTRMVVDGAHRIRPLLFAVSRGFLPPMMAGATLNFQDPTTEVCTVPVRFEILVNIW